MRLKKIVDSNRLLIFMQEKLAEMKSKFMTHVTIRVKPRPDVTDEGNHNEDDYGGIQPESFNVLNNQNEMGLAKQIVINDGASQIVAVADCITQPSDT